MIHKSQKEGKNIYLIREEYTSKICSYCLNLKDIGKSRIYECDICKNKFDRDLNSAKNIFIMSIL